MEDILLYQIALKNLGGIGPRKAKALVAYCGGVKEVFEASPRQLLRTPDVGSLSVKRMDRASALEEAQSELEFLEKENLQTFFYLDAEYPERLKHCDDGPILLYGKGNLHLNKGRYVSIVGTRDCTRYGQLICEKLVQDLEPFGVTVISGLAYGIDTVAHRASVESNIPTIGVLGHSLDRIYPHTNISLTKKMMKEGGLLSEFEHGTKPDRENFPRRNRIVAGMSDATIVIESGIKGGSIITARLAADYNRDVFAIPGPINAPYSSGCNHLIKTNQAALLEGVEDLAYVMGWERVVQDAPQKQLFVELDQDERKLCDLLAATATQSIDNLSLNSGFPMSRTSMLLLELEFKGVVKSLPGKIYCLT